MDTDKTTDAPPRVLLTVEEAAHRLSIGRTNMYALIKAGHVDTVRIGQLRRVPADALTAYVQHLTYYQAAA
ncbi:helix-turn-helix domain-containing protein [Haloechinothrix salitolerans]|uniref:Helix-turn-helix domain-containing protein n=1 Tax=Haloechinothrix salitolerans TaxID=926830 RepID=A0ABW2BT94_9PSEU